ncbi:MAG: hypothetical protein WCK16_00860 [Candidatus Moraniibacteriota bacterium]
MMNKQINTALAIAVIIIIAGIAGGTIYTNIANNNPATIIPVINKTQQNKVISKSSDDIAIGKSCDARNLKSYNGGGEIAATKGLQCYMYDDLSDRMLNNGKWIYPSGKETVRKGVWVYPNHMSIPIFLAQEKPSLFDTVSINDLTQNWKLYDNSNGNYSFKFPKQWEVKKDASNANQLTIEKINTTEANTIFATITYYPNAKFETTDDYQNINEAPDDWLVPDNSTDTFILTRHFDLNGATALLVERMNNFDLGGSSYGETIFVTKPNSYFTIEYTKYQDADIDLPVEMLIKTLRFK